MTRRCSQCGGNGHNLRTCPERTRGLGVRRVVSMSALNENAEHLGASSEEGEPVELLEEDEFEGPAAEGGVAARGEYASDLGGAGGRIERKKGVPWSEEEHRLFLLGLQKLGKGDWRGISRHFVLTRTPTQVASHAQKYFIRQSNLNKRKRRSSLFDIVGGPEVGQGASAGGGADGFKGSGLGLQAPMFGAPNFATLLLQGAAASYGLAQNSAAFAALPGAGAVGGGAAAASVAGRLADVRLGRNGDATASVSGRDAVSLSLGLAHGLGLGSMPPPAAALGSAPPFGAAGSLGMFGATPAVTASAGSTSPTAAQLAGQANFMPMLWPGGSLNADDALAAVLQTPHLARVAYLASSLGVNPTLFRPTAARATAATWMMVRSASMPNLSDMVDDDDDEDALPPLRPPPPRSPLGQPPEASVAVKEEEGKPPSGGGDDSQMGEAVAEAIAAGLAAAGVRCSAEVGGGSSGSNSSGSDSPQKRTPSPDSGSERRAGMSDGVTPADPPADVAAAATAAGAPTPALACTS